MTSNQSEVVGGAAKSLLPISVSGLVFAGISLDQWVLIVTLIWLALQIMGWIYDRFFKRRRASGRRQAHGEIGDSDQEPL